MKDGKRPVAVTQIFKVRSSAISYLLLVHGHSRSVELLHLLDRPQISIKPREYLADRSIPVGRGMSTVKNI